ncbi:MAG TPA: Sir2 family NAD-dependent protein deacetylase, partial [Isosphaeraceae bacterium]|nr:Sir2 family NAD-dependent protein deacetylase [Isosphaeraceae bacterium]
DGLHRAAGSRHVLEVHGTLLRVRCTGCSRIEDRGTEPLEELPHCPECGHLLRPDVVWFHEALPEGVWHEAAMAVRDCNCLLVVGTSAVVYPAAGLIERALAFDAQVIEVNLQKSEASHLATVGLYGSSGQILPRLVERL